MPGLSPQALDGEACYDGVRPSAQAQQHLPRFVGIGGLAQQVAVVHDDGVGGDDDCGRISELRGDCGGFLAAEAFGVGDQAFVWQSRFVYPAAR